MQNAVLSSSRKLAATRIALSYAQQANFDLKGARDTLLEATPNSSRKTHLPGPGSASFGSCSVIASAPAKRPKLEFASRPTLSACTSCSVLLR